MTGPTSRIERADGAGYAGGRHPLLPALAAQLLGALAAAVVTAVLVPSLLLQPLAAALFQGALAALASWCLRAPVWWMPIHLGFIPLVVLVRTLDLPSWLWPTGFILLAMIFWRTDRSRVPLYLSNRESANALLGLLPVQPCRVIDLGCGDGALLRRLAHARPDCIFVGIEHAPLPWIWARIAARRYSNLSIRLGDFWAHSLEGYAFVYAFLSPAAMPRLWARACVEMKNGAILVSNSFAVPGILAGFEISVPDARRTRLFLYRPGSQAVSVDGQVLPG